MNLKSKLSSAWNRLTTSADVQPQSPNPSPANSNVAIVRGSPASESGGSFEKHFATLTYAPEGIAFSRGFGIIYAQKPNVSGELWKKFFDSAQKKGLLTKAQKEELSRLKNEKQAVADGFGRIAMFTATGIRRAAQSVGVEKLLRGEVPTVPGFQEVNDSAISLREGLHNHDRELSKLVYQIVKDVQDKVQAVVEELAWSQDKKERADHFTNFGDDVAYKPSAYLCALVWLALVGVKSGTRNFVLTGRMACPDPDHLLAIWWNPAPSPQPVKPRDEARNVAVDNLLDKARLASTRRTEQELEEKTPLSKRSRPLVRKHSRRKSRPTRREKRKGSNASNRLSTICKLSN